MNLIAQKSWTAGLLVAAALALAGCHQAKVAHPLTAELSGSDAETQMSFWHTLATRPVTSNDEAFHGLLLYSDLKDPAGNYAERVKVLKSRKMLPDGFDAPADRAIERGTLAVAICRILEMRGGVMLRILPRSPRYAVRELEFEEVFPTSSSQQTFSGTEFLGIIGRIEDYQRTSRKPVAAATALKPVIPTTNPARPTTKPAK